MDFDTAELDETGWHILEELQQNGRISFAELGRRVGLTLPAVAERVRKIGERTIRSIGEVDRLKRVEDNDAEYVEPADMLAELREDNQALVHRLREARTTCEEHEDVATTSLIEVWIDETERRTWFLFEATRHQDSTGH